MKKIAETNTYITVDPKNTPTADVHQYLLGAVAPRPICFASTVDKAGNANIAPYSFFNCFSSNPPICVFSSNRKVADNTTKDTLQNVIDTREVVINAVSYNIVYAMSLASVEYPYGVSEFEKVGLTPLSSDLVRPFRIKESPVQMECKVIQILPLGDKGGAGNLIICEVVRMHINTEILDEDKKIDPDKIDLMGRMGRSFYCRASEEAVFPIYQNVNILGIGVDSLPQEIRHSKILTGNDIARIATLPAFPDAQAMEKASQDLGLGLPVTKTELTENFILAVHLQAQKLIAEDKVKEAFALLMCTCLA
ncbi:MAG: flavin reductase family protein [Chitinophagales bacterium]|nr:flavin reductase family protein [Bacteroidota bacterium]MCB9043276.1 flavin reductase family protein [Chitinophagales bacterium]